MATRSDFIGGSDANRILKGDWLPLYEEKLGIREPENLIANFPVQLGIHTERFHLDWLNKYHGFEIGKPQRFVHPHVAWMVAHVDGVCEVRKTFVDTKHSNGRASRETMIEWYQAQIAHYCMVMNVDHGWVSFIAGNAAPEFFKLTPAPEYKRQLFELEKAFWWHVQHQVPPDILPAKKLQEARDAAAAVLVDDMRTVDMTGNNQWASLVLDYLDYETGAKRFEAAKAGLKKLVEPDVRLAKGYGIAIKRSKNGALTFKKEGDDD